MTLTLSTIGPRIAWSHATDLVKNASVQQAAALVEDQQPDGSWNSDLDTSVIHHVALSTYLRRAAHAKEFGKVYDVAQRQALTPDAETRDKLESTLARSWKHLTGKVPKSQDGLLQPLPHRQVIKKLSLPAAQLHEALLGTSLTTRIEPQRVLQEALSSVDAAAQGGPLQAQPRAGFPTRKVLAAAGVAGAVGLLAVAPGLGQLVAGAAVGWAISSANESIVHELSLIHI